MSDYFFKSNGDFCAYHVVTQKSMQVGQQIVFDDTHHSGVYERVMSRINEVKAVYENSVDYSDAPLEHHLMVAMRELALEQIRLKKFPSYPSRLACLYVSKNLSDAISWAEFFKNLGREVFSIVKVRVNGSVFIADANNCFDAVPNETENLKSAERYWLNAENLKGEKRIDEVLVNGDIEVIEIIK